jgi:pantoate--beta-alanine ligase
MEIIKTVEELRNKIKSLKREYKTVGFVPTMGYLHEGHLTLIRTSVSENDITVASIFVNPKQFGPNEDFESYPKDFERDSKLLEENNTDILFLPSVEEMYPENYSTNVSVSGVSEGLCGAKREGHFDGVATVVTKLLNMVMPDRAYFGEKDYQQLQVIKRFVIDLNMDVEIKGVPIVREADGLAMSSRNVYLKEEERESALSLNRSFKIVQELIDNNEKDVEKIKLKVVEYIDSFPYTKIDYVEFVDPLMLKPIDKIENDFLMALAVFVGKARLIDNNIFEVRNA